RASGCRDAVGVRHAIDMGGRAAQVAEVGDRRDRRGGESAVPGGQVEVELPRPAVAEALVQGKRPRHDAGCVEGAYRRPGPTRPAFAGGQQSAGDTKPARGWMDGERASAGPAACPGEPLERGVRVERREPADLFICLEDEQLPVASVLFQVEYVGQV